MSPRKLSIFLVLLAAPAFASTRLTYDIRGAAVPVAWPASSFPIRYQVDRRLTNAVPMIERAFGEWSGISDARLSFQSTGMGDNLHPGFDHINSITTADGLFANQKCLAYTTPTHDDAGNLLDADIQIDASLLTSNNYNLQQVVAHEIGHLLGLDHSAVITAAMYPYVGPSTSTTPLDSDDRIGVAAIYPKNVDDGATLSGRVMGNAGAVFAAQVVALNARGEPVSTGLTDQNGDFMLKGVPPGDYRIYAEPLDGPVNHANLAGIWRQAREDTFPTGFASDSTPLHVDDAKIYGNIAISVAGNARLNPKVVGQSIPGSGTVILNTTPIALKPGTMTQINVGGDGFTSGMTTFEVLNPGFHQAGKFSYASDGSYVTAPFRIDADAPGGSAVILVHDGRDVAALTGALRIDAKTRVRAVGK